jgi:RimJ/RimL family protein N-acetyltransferase
VLDTTEAVLARIDALSPADRAEVSPEWLARMRSSAASPWTHGFTVVERASDSAVGSGGYKGPPDDEGMVEIAYGIEEAHRGRGYAKEVAAALTQHALDADVRLVRAHTRQENGASARVLERCGFLRVGEVIDPEDGLVCRWELRR